MNSSVDLRRTVYALLIVAAAAMAVGRILSAELVYEPSLSRAWPNDPGHPRRAWPEKAPRAMPTFSSNDRSRWAAVRALVDEGTWAIGRRDPHTGKDSGIIFEDGWQSVDKMLNPDTLEFYSTKPPLLTFLAAGEYWLLKKTFGWSLGGDSDTRFAVIRVCLLTFNVLPFVLYLWLLACLAERFGATDWGRLFVVTAACFATLISPFLISLNNHTLATCGVVAAVYAAVRILSANRLRQLPSDSPNPAADAAGSPAPAWLWFGLAGFFAGFTAVNELPAAAFAAGLGLLLALRFPKQTLRAFVPAALIPVAALLALNYAQLGDIKPAYSKFGTVWYEYEGSHWLQSSDKPKRGIDWAREDKATYAFHLLLGHHGWFSLTPIYVLALAGMGLAVRRLIRGGSASDGITTVANASASDRTWAELAAATALLSLVVIAYYIYKTNNYGGWSNGPRWLMWLSPLWLLTLLPSADRLGQRRWGRIVCLALLALSVMSAHYENWNPWRHPWIYNWMESRGWIPY
jgi:hypothetical protein